jgi:predicted glycosyltransferase
MSSAVPRLLFQAHSRRGLGHLARGLNLAREIRALAPAADISFHVSNAGAASFCPPSYRCLVDGGVPDAMPWAEAVRTIGPDVSVFDTVLRPDDVSAAGSRRVFVLRKTHGARHADLLSSGALEQMDLVVVPHQEAEFDSPLPIDVRRRTAFVGPIVRLPEAAAQDALRSKYGISAGDFVLTSTAGGGGFEETASRLFDTVWQAHEHLSAVVPRLRHIVVLGPQWTRPRAALPGMTVVQSEPDLVNLLALSSLVVAEGGYNTVNELRAVKTPAVFVPGARTYDDQEERTRALEAIGVARVLTGSPSGMARDLAAVAGSAETVEQMRRSYARDHLEPGNRAAAARILELLQ